MISLLPWFLKPGQLWQGSASLIGRSYAEAALTKVMNAVKVTVKVASEAEGGGLEMEEQMV
jgi:hypothetical protein